MVLNSEVWQGHFGEGFVTALAHAAGLNPAKKVLDVEGVDLQISYPGRKNGVRYPAIDVQIKSWSVPVSDDSAFRYPLPISNYDNLVGKVGLDFVLPRYLFLVVVPSAPDEYILASTHCLELRHAAYWLNLMDQPAAATLSVATTKTVYVPKANILTTETLLGLVAGRGMGGG